MEHPVIFFDGVCNLCNGVVKTITKLDHKRHFYFSSLQSDFAKTTLKSFGIDFIEPETIIFLEKDKIFIKSKAVFQISKQLGWLKIISVFSFLPTAFSDKIYDFVAQNRYKWFGKKEQCMLPDKNVKDRFLD